MCYILIGREQWWAESRGDFHPPCMCSISTESIRHRYIEATRRYIKMKRLERKQRTQLINTVKHDK